jgi:hypothetical protein
MFDRVRTTLHKAISTKAGDGLLPVRVPKDLARRVNFVLGEPLCSEEELLRRKNGKARLAALRRGEGPRPAAAPKIAAPVMVYFEKDRNARMLARIEDLLKSKGIAYTLLDVASDETTRAFVKREAQVKDDELPIVFVASTPVGDYNALVEWDVAGKLATAVWG